MPSCDTGGSYLTGPGSDAEKLSSQRHRQYRSTELHFIGCIAQGWLWRYDPS